MGKTTLLESFSSDYKTFDDPKELSFAMSEPDMFLENRKAPFAIDEAQFCPPLFPALKEFVRKHKTPGKFLLSGSVRFTSRKAIRESLTGRIVGVEVLPFTIAEAHQVKLPKTIEILISGKEKLMIETLKKTAQPKKTFFAISKWGDCLVFASFEISK